ncbi:hypothetical protein M7I_6841 [Glarea lozoyensis 74030]|uniref:Uncharacterized protein n=1 Tax=Glarea lozoyensis (strain ATCC 74030 / MF5533) TaxID=1104152 RepID=H0EVP0_GLAL7|nr:hypothetical protein M7I_6841 [Glarea lozoyensis 74030]
MAAHTQFKQYAYVWKPAFGQRQTLAYSKGNMSFVESIHRPQVSGITTGQVLNTLTTEQIIDTFVSNQFHQDVARYSYVEHLYEEFLRGVDFEVLKGKVPSTALGEAALLDDRNDAKGTRDIVSGYRRQSRGAMNAAQLYTTLLEPRVNTGTITSTIPDAERRTFSAWSTSLKAEKESGCRIRP